MSRHPLARHFDNRQIQTVIEEAMLYMCACPAQVSTQILQLRELHTYQTHCVSKADALQQVHLRIAESTKLAHDIMEDCLLSILQTEGWDLASLKMPEGLRELRQRAAEDD